MFTPEALHSGGVAAELKFLVAAPVAREIRVWAAERMESDPNATDAGAYRVSSVYYDNAAHDVFYRRGSFARTKFRIRRYGDADVVYLERKMKRAGILVKRRAAVPAAELELLDRSARIAGAWTGSWFRRRMLLRDLRPVCRIDYLRTARVGSSPAGPFRLTIDDAIAALETGEPEFESPAANVHLDGEILELKFPREMPAVFRELMETFGLTPQAISKYRTALAALRGWTPPEASEPNAVAAELYV